MRPSLALIKELDEAINRGSAARRSAMLQKVTELFLSGSEGYSDEDIGLFDDVIIRLAARIEQAARVLLAERLAPVSNAPPRIIHLLASDNAIEIACPVLAHSPRLADPFLVEIARTKSQDHLHAISRREALSPAVTDVLVERGEPRVALSAVQNAGARFSDAGYAILVQRSANDDRLALGASARPDLPSHLFLRLLATASKAVQKKLEAEHPRARREVHRVVAEVTSRIRAQVRDDPLDYAAAQLALEALSKSGRLSPRDVEAFAKESKLEEAIVALALLTELPIESVERAFTDQRPEKLVIVAKAVGLSWTGTKAVLGLRAARRGILGDDVEQCLAGFERLKRTTAQQLLRFQEKRNRT